MTENTKYTALGFIRTGEDPTAIKVVRARNYLTRHGAVAALFAENPVLKQCYTGTDWDALRATRGQVRPMPNPRAEEI